MKVLSLLVLGLIISSCNSGSGGVSGGKNSSGITTGASVYSQSIQDISNEVKTEQRYQISNEEVSDLDGEVDLTSEEQEIINKYL